MLGTGLKVDSVRYRDPRLPIAGSRDVDDVDGAPDSVRSLRTFGGSNGELQRLPQQKD